MAVRFILGRAGSGKTHHCLDAIRERLREDPLDGPRLILLVPEQAALQMERALLDPADASGGPPILVVHRAEVFSFRRLAFRILDTAGPPPAEALSETARAMVLRHIVRRHAASLRYYRSLAGPGTHTGLGGFIERLAASITELLQEAIDPADLAQAARGETPADNDLPRADNVLLPPSSRVFESGAMPDELGAMPNELGAMPDEMGAMPKPGAAGRRHALPPHGGASLGHGTRDIDSIRPSGPDRPPVADDAPGPHRSPAPGDTPPPDPVPGGGVDDNPAQRAKMHDLALIYRAYLDHLGDDKLDPTQYLQTARQRLPDCTWLAGADVWVDGFASFSGQEALTLIELAKRCRHVDITMMMDPGAAAAGPGTSSQPSSTARLFYRTTETRRDLEQPFQRAGVQIAETLRLDGRPPPRFARSDALAQLEERLFARPEPATPARRVLDDTPKDGWHGQVPMNIGTCPCPAESDLHGQTSLPMPPVPVELVELPSRRVEVEYAVSCVCRWVQDVGNAYRYRDIAIIARDLTPYHDLLREALTARGVPFFLDRRRPVAHHPLVELLRAATAVVARRFSLDAVRRLLKTGLLPIDMDDADALENYLIGHGISGPDAWGGDDWSMAPRASLTSTSDTPTRHQLDAMRRINEARRRVLALLDPWLTFAASPDKKSGAAWADAIRDWLGHLGVEATIVRWLDQAEADGELESADEQRQVWGETLSLLDDLAMTFPQRPLSIAELSDILDAGLSGLTLGLVPPTVDQVLVGAIDRSRHPNLKAVVVIGFNDGLFPGACAEDSVLNDDDRRRLALAGLSLRPPARQRIFDETGLAYVALTRASRSLVVTCATSDQNGKSLRPSPYFEAIRRACPGLAVRTVADPVLSREPWDVHSTDGLVARLSVEFRDRPPVTHDDRAKRALWNTLYEAVRSDLGADPGRRRVLASLADPLEERLSDRARQRLYPEPLTTSVSQLEAYATCPFRHFAGHSLRLREREEAALEPMDIGLVHHAVLEDFVQSLARSRDRVSELNEDALVAGLRESLARVAGRLPDDAALPCPRSAYVLRRTACELTRVLRSDRLRQRAGRFRPHATELAFGFDRPGALPPLTVTVSDGRRVHVRGYIDRVDLCESADGRKGVVIDYKRTADKTLDLAQVYHGLSLQLPVYMLALEQADDSEAFRGIRPIGALYVSLATRYIRVDHPDLLSERERARAGTYRPRGLLLADDLDSLDASDDTGYSLHYSLYRKADGTIGNLNRSDAMDTVSFRAVADHARRKLEELAGALLGGDVSVRPYRLGTKSPCTWCEMGDVCRFELGLCDVRFLEPITRTEALQRIGAAGASMRT